MNEQTITLSLLDYETLVRDSEKLEAVKRYIVSNKYISTSDITAILDIEEGEE